MGPVGAPECPMGQAQGSMRVVADQMSPGQTGMNPSFAAWGLPHWWGSAHGINRCHHCFTAGHHKMIPKSTETTQDNTFDRPACYLLEMASTQLNWKHTVVAVLYCSDTLADVQAEGYTVAMSHNAFSQRVNAPCAAQCIQMQCCCALLQIHCH